MPQNVRDLILALPHQILPPYTQYMHGAKTPLNMSE